MTYGGSTSRIGGDFYKDRALETRHAFSQSNQYSLYDTNRIESKPQLTLQCIDGTSKPRIFPEAEESIWGNNYEVGQDNNYGLSANDEYQYDTPNTNFYTPENKHDALENTKIKPNRTQTGNKAFIKPSGGDLREASDTSALYGGGATINPTANSSIKGTIRDNNSATVDYIVTGNIGKCEIGNRIRTKYDNNTNETITEEKVFFRVNVTDNIALTADCRNEDTGKTSYNIGFDYESSNLQINIGLRKTEGEDLTPGINVNYNF